jgi:predicted enzyme related to lactoylglutathione lyase
MAKADDGSQELRPGGVCYLQIPTTDVTRSATFYGTIFGWNVAPPDAGFEAPGLIGQWVTDRPVGSGTGPLLWISVDHLQDALEQAPLSGGTVLQPPSPDGSRMLATITDPDGNELGLAQHGSG